jgi:hypothetical protein
LTRLCRFTVISSVSILLATLLASTGGAAGGSPGSFPTGLAELCNLDCVVRGEIPDRGDGSPFEFVLGLATVESGLDLVIETEGSVYLAGPLDALTTIELNAGDIRIGDGLDIGSNLDIRLDGREEITISVPDLVLVSAPGLGAIGGANVSISGGGSFVSAQGAVGSTLVPAVERTKSGTRDSTITIRLEGDVYLDLTDVQLDSLTIRAGRSIVSQDTTISFVPEPSAGLLMGLGLAAMGIRRPTSRSSMGGLRPD